MSNPEPTLLMLESPVCRMVSKNTRAKHWADMQSGDLFKISLEFKKNVKHGYNQGVYVNQYRIQWLDKDLKVVDEWLDTQNSLANILNRIEFVNTLLT